MIHIKNLLVQQKKLKKHLNELLEMTVDNLCLIKVEQIPQI